MELMKTKKFKVLAIATAILAISAAWFGLDNMREKTSAITLQAPFYSNELGDNMFTVRGYGDLFVNIIRKDDGTSTGPLSFCLNKQKQFPSNSSTLYESIENDKWVWELDNTRVPSDKQVADVQRALYAYKYIFPEKLTQYGLEAENTMALYHAQQITQWAILEDWGLAQIEIKEDVKLKPQMLAYAQSVQRLYTDMYNYAVNENNSSYAKGIKVVLADTETPANYEYNNDDYITTQDGQGYFRSGLMQALPNQKAGYYIEGDFAFTYKVTPGADAPAGARIVNEYGVPQDTFSTKQGVGLNFYVDIPVESVVGKDGNFTVNIATTTFRRNAGILWRPVTETAYQTLLQNASIPDNATSSINLKYGGFASLSNVEVLKQGEQLNSFVVEDTKHGKLYKPVYKTLPLKDTKYTIEMVNKTGADFIFGEDGQVYVDGQNLIQKGNVITNDSGIALFYRVPLDKERDTTQFKVIETKPANGFTLGTDISKVTSIDKTASGEIKKTNVKFTNERVKANFEFKKLAEYISSEKTKTIDTKKTEGILFGIYTTDKMIAADGSEIEAGTLIATTSSDKEGVVSGEDIDIPLGHLYKVKELETKDDLTLDTKDYYLDARITTNGDENLVNIPLTDDKGAAVDTLVNHLKRGVIKIHKEVEAVSPTTGDSSYSRQTDATGYTFKIYNDEDKTNLVYTLSNKDFENNEFVLRDIIPGTYYIEEITTPTNQTVNKTLFKTEVKALEENVVVIQNKLKTHSHTLLKVNITNPKDEKTMSGVTFDVKINNIVVGSETTKTDGKLSLQLKDGVRYTLSERVPAGYEKVSDEPIEIIGGVNKETIIRVENKKETILGSISITKEEKVSKKALANVGFALYRKSDVSLEAALAEDITNSNGQLTFKGLAPDEYQVIETVPLSGYLPKEPISVDLRSIKNNDTISLTVDNEKYHGRVSVIKKDASTGNVLANAKLGLFTSKTSENAIATLISGKDGKVTFDNVPYGQYYVGEIQAPKGFELSSERVLVDLTDITKEEIEITFTNNPIKGKLEIVKKDTDDDSIYIADTTFKLYRYDNGNKSDYITTLTTGKNGKVVYDGIYQDTYLLEEVNPGLGYALSNREIVVDASSLENNQLIRATVYNKKQVIPEVKGSISIDKVDLESGEITNATFALLNKANEIVATKETVGGKTIFEDLSLGEYKVVEKTAANGYLVNETIFNVLLTNTESNQTLRVENKKQNVVLEDGIIQIKKYDEASKELLPGVKFNVYKKGEDGIFKTVITNDEGTAVVKDLKNGLYTVVEAKPLEDYAHNDTQFTVELNEDTREGIISAYNKKATHEEIEEPEVKAPVIEIPETGAFGNRNIYMVAGIVIMLISAISGAFMVLKSKNKE